MPDGTARTAETPNASRAGETANSSLFSAGVLGLLLSIAIITTTTLNAPRVQLLIILFLIFFMCILGILNLVHYYAAKNIIESRINITHLVVWEAISGSILIISAIFADGNNYKDVLIVAAILGIVLSVGVIIQAIDNAKICSTATSPSCKKIDTSRPSIWCGIAVLTGSVTLIFFGVLFISWLVGTIPGGGSENGEGDSVTGWIGSQVSGIRSVEPKVAICNLTFPSVLFFLSLGFLASLCWALLIYVKMRSVLWPANRSESSEDEFRAAASRHGQLSQLWFSIAITVLLGAVIFAIFQISQSTCGKSYNLEESSLSITGKAELFVEIIKEFISFLSKLFIYSLFFACWIWSVKNYKAHWHAYVSNEYRYTAFHHLNKIDNDMDHWTDRKVREEIILKEANLLGSIPLSPYLDKEREETAAQKIIKIEEMLQELLTKSHR
jgi:hypothetical protein